MLEVFRYTAIHKAQWNKFAARARQSSFLFQRDYMDYHAQRFRDNSLIVLRNGRIHALLPANIDGQTLYSHQGLTYGGLITDNKTTTADVCQIFKEINNYLRAEGIRRLIYKPTPWIYHLLPAEEDLYAISTICNAHLIARHISSTICPTHRLPFTESRKSGIRKAQREALQVREATSFESFWNILTQNLENKYHVRPVHTLDEIVLLKSRFPEAIRLFQVENQSGTVLGGTVIYETQRVVHTQYISASPVGKVQGALDLLFHHLLTEEYKDVEYFDFGKSSEGDGHDLNAQLIFQKEGFGGRGVCYDTYEWIL